MDPAEGLSTGPPAGPLYPGLARIVAAWPELPEPIRRAMLALADASK